MKKALIIGPDYPAPYQLAATPNNISNWTNTLQNYRGFQVQIFSGTRTRAAIQGAMQSFVGSLTASDSGTIVLLGHGGRVFDVSGDEADGYDECFAASDLLPIYDDWIGALLASVASGCKLDIVLDMCYAGTGTRAAMIDAKAAPKIDANIFPDQTITFKQPKKAAVKAKAIVPANLNHRLWAACAEGELSYTVISGGLAHSILSLYLCWALRAYPAKNATEIMNIVAAYVTAAIPSQHPQLEGSNLTAIPF